MNSEKLAPGTKPVAVVDVGSNTIKMLVAQFDAARQIQTLATLVEETRIGEGINGTPPAIQTEAIARGAAAIARLVEAAPEVSALCIVATSAVRDASNKATFVNAVERATGHEMRILSGDEEALLIARGIRCDPQIRDLTSFSLLDLGGGSLECIQVENSKLLAEQSLQLGAVRLASQFLKDRARPLSRQDRQAIVRHVEEAWRQSLFAPLSSPCPHAILTGGAANHVADMISPEKKARGISLEELDALDQRIGAATLEERVEDLGIPRSRADIFPTAIATLSASLRYLGCHRIRFSSYNLRFGIAEMLLENGSLTF